MTSSSWQTARHRIGYQPTIIRCRGAGPCGLNDARPWLVGPRPSPWCYRRRGMRYGPAGCRCAPRLLCCASLCPLCHAPRGGQTAPVPVARGPGQPRRHRHRQQGRLVADSRSDDFESSRTENADDSVTSPGDGGAGQPDMHLGLLLDVSGSMGEDIELHAGPPPIKFLNTLTDAVDITVVDFDTEVRTARYSRASSRASSSASGRRRPTATRRCTTRSASISTAPPARTAARSCCSTPTAATRAARCRFHELLESAQGLRRHRLRDRRARAPDAVGAGVSSA